jgi:serine O-acetyltransferase
MSSKRIERIHSLGGTAFCLEDVVEDLKAASQGLQPRCERAQIVPLPSRNVIHEVTESLRALLFPGYFGRSEITPQTLSYHLGHGLDQIHWILQEQIERSLAFAETGEDKAALSERAARITATFLRRLPAIKRVLVTDVHAAYEGDPAATSPDEAIFCYPGVRAVTKYRLAHELYRLGVPLLPRIISEQAHSLTGIDIHPGAVIGPAFFIDHGTGVVIGETSVIGERVRLYQGVTLGAKSFPLDDQGRPVKGIPRHPLIEDDVVIYSGATILGRVTIGRGSVIGGNVWLTRSIPPLSRITVQPPRSEEFENGGGI